QTDLRDCAATRISHHTHDETPLEYFRECSSHDVGYDAHIRCVCTEHALQGCHTTIRNAARHDCAEEGKIGCDVECKAVRRNPSAGDAHTDGADLRVVHPHASESGNARGGNVPGAQCTDDDFLDITDVAMQIAAIRLEVEDGVTDELTGAVIGDVATAPGLEQFDGTRGTLRRIEQ